MTASVETLEVKLSSLESQLGEATRAREEKVKETELKARQKIEGVTEEARNTKEKFREELAQAMTEIQELGSEKERLTLELGQARE